MALYDGLPIYKATYDFLLQVFIVSKNFTREYKYTIGQDLKNESMALILDIYRANSSRDRRYILLEEARITLETIRILIRLTKDLAPLSDLEQEKILAQMDSYLGLLSHTQSYRLRSKMMSILDERFWEYFDRGVIYARFYFADKTNILNLSK